jgi:N4-gp56 family major capsid protein
MADDLFPPIGGASQMYDAGAHYSDTLPAWQRVWYEATLLETLRTKSILVPFCVQKEDFRARDTGVMHYTEVYDTAPNWNPLAEQDIWLRGAHLDSRSVVLTLEIHGDTLKFSDYADIVQYVNRGDIRGLVRDKIGQNMRETLDILARNAFLDHPNTVYSGGTRASRADIRPGDLFDPDLGELARTHLEENEIPGVIGVKDGEGGTIVCITTPRVIHDIRNAAGSAWLEVNNYQSTGRKFSSEVGMWAGVRYIRTNRLAMKNHGAVNAQTALVEATVPGQGAASTVDKVYSPGQPNSRRYVQVASTAEFSVGQYVTIHSRAFHENQEPLGPGDPSPHEQDGTQETRRIVTIDADNGRLSFDKPLLKPHSEMDLVTNGVDIHGSIFIGGPSVVMGIGERPTPIFPPKIDDLQMINRYGWRAFCKFQQFRPEYIEVHETAGSTN